MRFLSELDEHYEIEHVTERDPPLKYWTLKTLDPDSVAAPCNLGEWISMKPFSFKCSRKS